MRYFELWREKFTNKIVKIMDLSAKEYNSRKVDMEVYLKKQELSKLEKDPYYSDFKELEEDSFECHCLDYAYKANKKYLTLQKGIRKLVSED